MSGPGLGARHLGVRRGEDAVEQLPRALEFAAGEAVRVGSVGAQRLAVPCLVVRSEGTHASEALLQTRLLQKVQVKLADNEALVCDRGFPLAQLQAAGIPRYVSRGPVNFTARRAVLAASPVKVTLPLSVC